MKYRAAILLMGGCVVLMPMKSSAVGLGVHFTGGATLHRGYMESQFGDRTNVGAGLTLDTAVAMNSLFNYRLHIGYVNQNGEIYHYNVINEHTLTIQNSFGFGVVRRKHFRYWLGPHVQFYYVFKENSFNANLGLAMGFNINMEKLVTLSIDLGARAAPLETDYGYEKKYTARIEPFVNLCVLFRIGDEYVPSSKKATIETIEVEPIEEKKNTTEEKTEEKDDEKGGVETIPVL